MKNECDIQRQRALSIWSNHQRSDLLSRRMHHSWSDRLTHHSGRLTNADVPDCNTHSCQTCTLNYTVLLGKYDRSLYAAYIVNVMAINLIVDYNKNVFKKNPISLFLLHIESLYKEYLQLEEVSILFWVSVLYFIDKKNIIILKLHFSGLLRILSNMWCV